MRSDGCVCLPVTLNLTSRVFVRLTKDTTNLTGNEGQKFGAVFSENHPLQVVAILSLRKMRMRVYLAQAYIHPRACSVYLKVTINCGY